MATPKNGPSLLEKCPGFEVIEMKTRDGIIKVYINLTSDIVKSGTHLNIEYCVVLIAQTLV